MNTFQLRKAFSADIAAVEQCVADAYAPYEADFGLCPAPLFADYPAAIEQKRVTLICKGDTVAGLVVCDVVGSIFLLENVAVAPVFQGRGLARQLITAAETMAQEASYDAIILYTHQKMTRNQNLYHHLGYREIERRYEDGYDRVYMRKVLSSNGRC